MRAAWEIKRDQEYFHSGPYVAEKIIETIIQHIRTNPKNYISYPPISKETIRVLTDAGFVVKPKDDLTGWVTISW